MNRNRIEGLQERINRFPRVKLAFLPTPLHEVPRFSQALGGPRIFIKRDDLTGFAFGGNKSRMFEFLLGKVRMEGADTVIGGAGVQSNYCRQLAAACNSLGLEVHLVLRRIRGEKDDTIQGNLLLDLLSGASVHIVSAEQEGQKRAIYDLAEELRGRGKKPFVVRMAGDRDLTPDVIAYVSCFCEILEQLEELGIDPSRIYVASYDTTQAGLELGRAVLGSHIRIMGVAPAVWEQRASDLIAMYANQAAEALDVPQRFEAEAVDNTADYVGEKYGVPTERGIEMIKLMARTEGIFLDPVYTSKAMSALYEHIKRGELKSGEIVLFLHTGGNPALFAYADELGTAELTSRLFFD